MLLRVKKKQFFFNIINFFFNITNFFFQYNQFFRQNNRFFGSLENALQPIILDFIQIFYRYHVAQICRFPTDSSQILCRTKMPPDILLSDLLQSFSFCFSDIC